MKEWVKRQLVRPDHSIREVMTILSAGRIGAALIVDAGERLIGFVTDNDIRRAILRDVDLNATKISEIMTKDPVVLRDSQNTQERLEVMRQRRVNRAPVLDDTGRVLDIALKWELQDGSSERDEEESDFRLETAEGIPARETVLVVGGAGYIGSVLCRYLLEIGFKVRVLDCLLFGSAPIDDLKKHPQFEFIHGDVRNLETVVNACFGVRAVVNLAALVGDAACELDANHTIMVNYISAKALADVCKHLKVERYLFISTCSVYGASRDSRVLREDSMLNPVSLYAETKLKTESGILGLADKHFSPCILRLATVYGLSPRMRFDLVVNTLTIRALLDKEIRVFGGKQWRPNVHVRDVARAIGLSLRSERAKMHREIFNVGSDRQNHQIETLAQIIADTIGGVKIHQERTSVDERNYKVGFEKIRNVLGFEAEEDIPGTVREIQRKVASGRYVDFIDKRYSNVKQQEHHVFG